MWVTSSVLGVYQTTQNCLRKDVLVVGLVLCLKVVGSSREKRERWARDEMERL